MPSPGFSGVSRYLYGGAIVALVLAGCLVRTWGILPIPLDFWADEAWWATLLESGEFSQFGFRPVAYMWVSRALLEIGPPELWLRVPSVLAGCAAVYLLFRSAELSTRTRTAVLFVTLVAAFHPKLVVFSKEFKPYAVEVFVVSALTFWTLHWKYRRRGRTGLVAAALIALPFCYPVVFLYPAIAFSLAEERLACLRGVSVRQWVYGGLAVIPLLAASHFFLFEMMDAGGNRLLWGAKYDVFPLDTGFLGGVAWYVDRSWSLLTLPGALEGMPEIGRTLFGIVVAGGVAVLVSARRYGELVLFAAPLAAAAAANFLGYWPYGEFRTNLFLIPGVLLLAAQSVDWLTSQVRSRWLGYGTLAAVASVVLIAGAEPYRTKQSEHWTASPQITEVIAEIGRRGGEIAGWSDVILADWHSWRPLLYYLPRVADLRDEARLLRGPVADLAALESMLGEEIGRIIGAGQPTRLWLVVTELHAHERIRDNDLVERYQVFQREFATYDRSYHPLLIELRIGTPAELLGAAAQRYHPRPCAIRAS